jgi:hypothetical protein
MPEPPGDYEDFLGDADGLVAEVKLYRAVVASAARGSQGIVILLALLLPALKELLGEVKGALAGAGRQKAGTPQPRGNDPPASGSTDPLSDLERLLGEVEGALTRRN